MSMRLYKQHGGSTVQFLPSAQTHCDTEAVETWIMASADSRGAIHNVSVEMHGKLVPVADAAEVRIVAALFAADHNDYVALNLCYNIDTSPADRAEAVDVYEDAMTDYHVEDDMELWKLDDAFEQNEEMTVNTFGPSHSKHSDW